MWNIISAFHGTSYKVHVLLWTRSKVSHWWLLPRDWSYSTTKLPCRKLCHSLFLTSACGFLCFIANDRLREEFSLLTTHSLEHLNWIQHCGRCTEGLVFFHLLEYDLLKQLIFPLYVNYKAYTCYYSILLGDREEISLAQHAMGNFTWLNIKE